MNLLLSLSTALLCFGATLAAQTNTAITSGSIGKCAVWDYPYTLYNTAGASQTVNNGVTVTVDQNRNIGAVNLAGSGAMDLSGANGITLSGAGGEINCRFDTSRSGSYSVMNNNGVTTPSSWPLNTGVFFTAPYAGKYIWNNTGGGWSGSVSGAHLNGGVVIFKDGTTQNAAVFFQNQAGTCGNAPGSSGGVAASWTSPVGPITLTAGQTLSYRAGTAYNSAAGCTNTTLNFSLGNATLFYDN